MKRELKKFESTMWLCIKLLLYILLMGTFMFIMSRENRALGVLSRTMVSHFLPIVLWDCCF